MRIHWKGSWDRGGAIFNSKFEKSVDPPVVVFRTCLGGEVSSPLPPSAGPLGGPSEPVLEDWFQNLEP